MAKGLIIEALAGPPEESADESAELPEEAAAEPPRANPEALIASIESQLAQLRGLL
jgi:hypothetical protein